MKKHPLKSLIAAGVAILSAVALAEDPYIESDGTQTINTGYHVNARTKIVVDFQQTEKVNQMRLFGQNGRGNYAQVYSGDGNTNLKFGYGNASFSGAVIAPNNLNRNTIIYDGPHNVGYLVQNGVTNATVQLTAAHDGTSTLPMAIFANAPSSDNGAQGISFENLAKMRLYGFQIYEDDVLIHDYIPARRNGLFGLYDTVAKVFLKDNRQGANAGTFTGSDNVPDIGDAPHIENVTGQVINSRAYKTPNTRFEIDFALTAKPESASDGGSQWRIAGQDSSTKPLSFYTGGSVKDDRTFSFGQGDAFVAKSPGYKLDFLRHQVITDLPAKKLYFTTGEFGAATTNWVLDISDQANTQTSTMPLALMGYMGNANAITRSGNDAKSSARAKYYRCRVFESGVLTHDYVPCVKGGEPGFRDLVDGAFVTSEEKTDIAGIRAGGDVPVIDDDPYIEAFGIKQVIDTGYKASTSTRVVADFALTTNACNNAVGGLPAITQPWIYGYIADKVSFGAYVGGGAVYSWLCSDNSNMSRYYGSGISVSYRRRQMTVDAANSSISISTAGFTNEVNQLATDQLAPGTNTSPLMLFTRRSAGSVEALYPFAKLYGFQIYEAGELVRDFRPYIKNGKVGLRDELHPDTFVTTSDNPLRCGGAIAGDDQGGAYIQTDGTQVMTTGYKPNKNSKIEVTFAFDKIYGQDRVFCEVNNMCAELYVQGTAVNSGNMAFIYGNPLQTLGGITTSSYAKRTAVLDFYHNTYSITGGSSGSLDSSKVGELVAGHPIALFGKANNAAGTTFTTSASSGVFSRLKMYSFKIYESGVLLHHYLPYKDGDTVCFKDVADGGTLVQCTYPGANPFRIGGKGWNEDGDVFYTQPQDGVKVSVGKSTTLSAYAPGAIGYQWYKDGVALADETGMMFTVPWQQKPRTATYSVKARFDVNGVPVEVESDPATVNFSPRGFMVIVK